MQTGSASHASADSPIRLSRRAARIVGRPVRVLVVDDSVVMRRLLTRMLATDPLVEVVGAARDGQDALGKVSLLKPDLVTLDVEMPEMDGLEVLRLIQAEHPAVRVIMCSSLTQRGASVTIDALLAGASDYVAKQHSAGLTEDAYTLLQAELLSKIHHVFHLGQPSDSRAAAKVALPDTYPTAHSAQPSFPSPFPTRARQAPAFQPRSRALSPEVLVIGVSTGGPAALAEILPMLPADFPLPVAIVQHMPPFFTQMLAERLSRLCPLPVREAENEMAFEPGSVVLARGDSHMRLVRRGRGVRIELNRQQPENSCRPAVDVLFRSTAEVYAGAAIAVVLTGMGQDGLEGVRALKARGATALVQDSATSVIWGMPGAIASADLADAILPLHEIIPEVSEAPMTPNTLPLPAATFQPPPRAAAIPSGSLSPRNYALLQRYIHAGSGIVLEEDKQYLLESRLLPILKEHAIGSLDELSLRLSKNESALLGRQVVEAMTTNETLFFRDPAVFEALRHQVFPALFDRIQGTRKLRIWSAAAATGQEAYSLAMMLLEMGKSRMDVEILATDLSSQVLERARTGKYGQFEVNRGIPTPMLMRYFTRSGLAWQIKDEVRNLVRFDQLDLRRDFCALGTFDLVLCRNVLIYFDMATKRQILSAIRERLRPGSMLALGCSETVINVHDGFERVVLNQSTFYSI